jgi:hypothetical protein
MRALLLSLLSVALVALVACAPKHAEPPAEVVLYFPRSEQFPRCDGVAPVRRALPRTDPDAVLRALDGGNDA